MSPKLPVGTVNATLRVRRAERHRGDEIVDDLRDDARPVDRVDGREPHAVAERVVVEQRLHERLAVVEGAVDRHRMDVVVGWRRHHPALHVGDAAVRIEHDEIDALGAAEGLDRGAAGIARGRDHDGGAVAALLERVVHQPRQELHREVFEGERRPVEEFEHERVWSDLDQRGDGRMAEGRVGLARHAAEFGRRQARARERRDDLGGDFRVGPPGQSGDPLRRKSG